MISTAKLITAVNIIDDQIINIKDELSYLEAAKKNLQALIDRDPSGVKNVVKEDKTA